MIDLKAIISPDGTEVQLDLSVDDGGNQPFSTTLKADALLELIETLIAIREEMTPSIAEAEKGMAASLQQPAADGMTKPVDSIEA